MLMHKATVHEKQTAFELLCSPHERSCRLANFRDAWMCQKPMSQLHSLAQQWWKRRAVQPRHPKRGQLCEELYERLVRSMIFRVVFNRGGLFMAVRSSPHVRALPWPLAPLFAAEGPLPAREGALGGVGRWTGHWSTRPRKAFLNNQDCLIYPTNRGKGSFMLTRNILRDAKRGPPPLLPLLPWPWTPPWKPGSGTPGGRMPPD